MKPFRFFIQQFPKGSHTIDKQMELVFTRHDELMKVVDTRIAWAKTRSQSESWWDLDRRSCSEHYALIDGFDKQAAIIRGNIALELLDALWCCLRRQGWDAVKSHTARASDGVNQLNQMFRPTR